MIRAARLELRLTLAEVAAESGLSVSHLSHVESGRHAPSEQVIEKLAGPLDLDPVALCLAAGRIPAGMMATLAADPEAGAQALRVACASLTGEAGR